MSYIGKEPADSFISFAKQDFTTSATTSYTLDNAVANENELALFINFVRQEPTTAYTASGTTLTLTSATASTDDMYCVYLGQAKQTVNPPDGSVSAAKLASDSVTAAKLNDDIISGQTALASEPSDTDEFLVSDAGTLKRIDYSLIKGGGITEVDMWQMSDQTYSHDDWIDTGWSRFNPNSLGGVPHGTGLSESSGIFTFPSTGVYEILFQTYFWAGSSATRSYLGVDVRGSTDAFASDYTRLGLSYTNVSTAGDHSLFTISCIYDVTNTSNNKIRFQAQGTGSTGYYMTKLITKKLMET